jgi:hypothetical protein
MGENGELSWGVFGHTEAWMYPVSRGSDVTGLAGLLKGCPSDSKVQPRLRMKCMEIFNSVFKVPKDNGLFSSLVISFYVQSLINKIL